MDGDDIGDLCDDSPYGAAVNDFDGDGTTDANDMILTAGDWDGGGDTDPASYKLSTSMFTVAGLPSINLGQAGDLVVPIRD